MSIEAGYALGPADGRGGAHRFLGKPVRMLAGSGETASAYTLFEQELPRGFAPPLHVHHTVDEAFYLLSGTMRVQCGEDHWEAGRGGFVFLPRAVPHSFLVTSPTAAMLQLTSPGDFEGFAREVADVPLTEENLPLVTEAAGRHALTILGPPPFS
ncbi:MAG TPA: cupin domain-containing protein [Streptomyces sp.]|jgi:mannose-6-phosphate isomerase-like protein (cupin superfamily)|nr:cupin domain-containing protein [Streptomyces sp.]